MKVLVFGSLNIDYVYKVKHFVQPGETLASDDMQIFCGGKGLNQSIAFCYTGIDTWHAGAVGRNDSDMLLRKLNEAGVHTELVQKTEFPTGHTMIQTTPEGENSIILYGGANQTITKDYIDSVLSFFKKGDYLILQNEINQIPYIMERAHEIEMKIVLNPSPMNEKIFDMPLSYVDFLILNELEGMQLSGILEKEGRQILDALTKHFPNAQIVLTMGKEGAVYGYREENYYQPIYPVKTVDTTAAGDTFTGFFMGSIICGKTVKDALDTAARAASIAVGRNGASDSIPKLDEVKKDERWRKGKEKRKLGQYN